VNRDRGDAAAPQFELGKFLRNARDPKVWLFAMMFFNTTTVSYALAYFTPIILTSSLGFDAAASQLLTAPPAAFAGIIMFATGWLGDKHHVRAPIILFNGVMTIVGLAILGWHPSSSVRYIGMFFTTAGANSNVPALMAYQANNIRGQWKRAFCSATLVGFGGIGGITGSLVFRCEHFLPFL
jgi:MFS family permease